MTRWKNGVMPILGLLAAFELASCGGRTGPDAPGAGDGAGAGDDAGMSSGGSSSGSGASGSGNSGSSSSTGGSSGGSGGGQQGDGGAPFCSGTNGPTNTCGSDTQRCDDQFPLCEQGLQPDGGKAGGWQCCQPPHNGGQLCREPGVGAGC